MSSEDQTTARKAVPQQPFSQQPTPQQPTPDQSTPDIIEVGFTPGNRVQGNAVIESREYTDKEKKALLALADRLVERQNDRKKNTICGSGDDIPINFDPEKAQPELSLNTYKGRLVKKFYASKKRWVCSFASCRKEVEGFGKIIKHLRLSHASRQYKYFCVQKNCMTPFNKQGNANRHFRNVHLNERPEPESDDETIEGEYPTCEGHKTPGHVPWARPAKYFDVSFGRKCADALTFKNATHPSAKKVDSLDAFNVACTLQSLMYYSDSRVKKEATRNMIADHGLQMPEKPNENEEEKEQSEQTSNCDCFYAKKH